MSSPSAAALEDSGGGDVTLAILGGIEDSEETGTVVRIVAAGSVKDIDGKSASERACEPDVHVVKTAADDGGGGGAGGPRRQTSPRPRDGQLPHGEGSQRPLAAEGGLDDDGAEENRLLARCFEAAILRSLGPVRLGGRRRSKAHLV